MANKRLSMRRIKEVLRLHYESGLGLRQISRALSVSPSTVREYLRRADVKLKPAAAGKMEMVQGKRVNALSFSTHFSGVILVRQITV